MAKQVVSASILELLVWCRDESCLELSTISVSLACPHFLQTAASPIHRKFHYMASCYEPATFSL